MIAFESHDSSMPSEFTAGWSSATEKHPLQRSLDVCLTQLRPVEGVFLNSHDLAVDAALRAKGGDDLVRRDGKRGGSDPGGIVERIGDGTRHP